MQACRVCLGCSHAGQAASGQAREPGVQPGGLRIDEIAKARLDSSGEVILQALRKLLEIELRVLTANLCQDGLDTAVATRGTIAQGRRRCARVCDPRLTSSDGIHCRPSAGVVEELENRVLSESDHGGPHGAHARWQVRLASE